MSFVEVDADADVNADLGLVEDVLAVVVPEVDFDGSTYFTAFIKFSKWNTCIIVNISKKENNRQSLPI